MKRILLPLLLLMATATFAQKETLAVASFNSVEAFGPFDIELIKSDEQRVEIDYRGIDKEDIISEVQRGVIKLKLKNRHYFQEWNEETHRKSEYVVVKLYYTDIDILEAKAGAVITARELLKSKYLRIESSMGAEIKLNILAKNVETKTSMGGLLELAGQVEQLDATAKMGGVLKASKLESKVVFVKATMGAEVTVNAKDEIEVSSALGATVHYIGGPAVRYTNKSMGGEVKNNWD